MNVFDTHLTDQERECAQKVLAHFPLDNLRILATVGPDNQACLLFAQDRRVVTLPLELVEQEDWGSIRFLFSSILGDAPVSTNHGSLNVWSGEAQKRGKEEST